MMFGLIKRSTHEAVVAGLMGDVAVTQAEANRLTAEVRQVREANETLRRWIAEERAAHNAAAAERDAMRPDAERYRAGLARLAAANAARKAAAESKRAH